jgi:hypothetical protein
MAWIAMSWPHENSLKQAYLNGVGDIVQHMESAKHARKLNIQLLWGVRSLVTLGSEADQEVLELC